MRDAIKLSCGLIAAIWAGALWGASPDPRSYEAVSVHPRWISFTQKVNAAYVDPVPTGSLAETCRAILEVMAREGETDDPVDACITMALYVLDSGRSSYSTPIQYQRESADEAGRFVGVGLELEAKKIGKPLRVVSTIGNSPGHRAGVRGGDDLIEVDGLDVLPLTIDEVIHAMRGKAGTVVRLTVLRHGSRQPITFSITREEIRIATVRSKWLSEDIAYVRVSQMKADTARSLMQQLATFQAHGPKQAAGLVLDLRTNPGGDFESVDAIASLFVPAGTDVVAVAGQAGTQVHHAAEPNLDVPSGVSASAFRQWLVSVPMAVLVDERTGGAAEAIAQFLREKRSARIMGKRTFGSSEIRTYLRVGDDAAMRLTTARMVSPSGSVWRRGVLPDDDLSPQSIDMEKGGKEDDWAARAVTVLRGASAGPH